jgi:hypothetical protein
MQPLLTRLLLTTICIAGSLLLSACNIVGPAVVLVSGPPTTPAAYTLNAEQPTVILVDDRSSVLPRRTLRTTIADAASSQLLKENSVKVVIDAKSIQAVMAREPADKPANIAALGRAVKASQVIYVSIDRFALSPDGTTYQPYADARVKVIDVDGGRTWPTQREGHALRVLLPIQRNELPNSAGIINKAQDALADRVGIELSRLFFKHETRDRVSEQRPN